MKITLLKGLLLVGAFLCFGLVQAQDVSGTVSDASGPLPGASVVVKGTTNGTQTDFDGNYTLDGVDSNAVLVFSYIDYATQEVSVNGHSTINVVLEEDAQAIDEVVIIGYGQTTVKDATGAIAAVTSEEFNRGVINSPEQLIQGKTAGVNVQQVSGEPGAGIQIELVANPDIGVVLNADTAFRTGPHFIHVVLESTQRLELAFVNDDVVSQHTDRVVSLHVTLGNDTAGDVAEFR